MESRYMIDINRYENIQREYLNPKFVEEAKDADILVVHAATTCGGNIGRYIWKFNRNYL